MNEAIIKQLSINFNLVEGLVSEVVNTLAKHYDKTVAEFVANIFVSDQARKAFVNLYTGSFDLLKEA